MNLRAKIGGSEYFPLIEGTSVDIRRPVSSAILSVFDEDGDMDFPTLAPVEVQINNRVKWSQDFDRSEWVKSEVTVTPGAGVDPVFGGYTPQFVTETATTAQHFLYQSNLTATNSTPVVWSMYAKRGTGFDTVRLLVLKRDWSSTVFVHFDLALGTILATGGSPDFAAIEAVGKPGEGWYRLSIGTDTGAGSNPAQGYLQMRDGSSYGGTSGVVVVFGAQWQEAQTALEPYNITLESSTIFDGFVMAATTEPMGAPPSRRWRMECTDWSWRLDNPPGVITKAYHQQTDRAILIDALAVSGLSSSIVADSSSVASLVSNISIAFDGATPREVIDQLSRASGAAWAIQNRRFYYALPDVFEDAAWTLRTSPTHAVQHRPRAGAAAVVRRHSDPINSAEVVGPILQTGRRSRATATDATSIAAYGTYHRKFEFPEIATTGFAQQIANQIVAAGKDPRASVSFVCSDDAPGRMPITSVSQALSVEMERLGVGAAAGPTYEKFVSREIRIKQLAKGVSEFAVTAGPFLPTTTDTLRKIEASLRSRTSIPAAVGAIDFDAASSEYAESGTTLPNLDDMATFSIAATIRCDSIASNRVIIAKDTGSNLGWRLLVSSAGNLQLVRTGTTNSDSIRPFPGGFVAGRIYRIVAVFGGLTTRFWVDGVESTTGGGVTAGTGYDSDVGGPIRVARRASGSYFDGAIGSLAVWDMALPVTTANALHNLRFSDLPFPGRIQLGWALDEFASGASASGTVFDRSANAYDGATFNIPTGDLLVYVSQT
jgi:hypothetical protein